MGTSVGLNTYRMQQVDRRGITFFVALQFGSQAIGPAGSKAPGIAGQALFSRWLRNSSIEPKRTTP
jgi:hypothetical protein